MAQWKGEWYSRTRKKPGTWRNRRTGEVSLIHHQRSNKLEPTGYHTYGRDETKPYLKKPIYTGMPKALRKNLFKKR